MEFELVDILLLSNGPGEVATWVRPVVRALRQKLGNKVRISVVLSPCPNATGKEEAIAKSYPEVDRVQGAKHFSPFLLRGVTAQNWDWHPQGVVVFLGGDQFFPVVIGKRLGYQTVVYAEWETRWHRWIDKFGVMKPEVIAKAPRKYWQKMTVVGDLMADVQGDGEMGRQGDGETGGNFSEFPSSPSPPHPRTSSRFANTSSPPHLLTSSPLLIGLLPGSKAAKLSQGVPFSLAIAQYIYNQLPNTRFVIPVAPSLDLPSLAEFADSRKNSVIPKVGGVSGQLVIPDSDTGEKPFLKTSGGLRVELVTEFPAYDLLCQCSICLTTVGANTAELGALAVPMMVLLPTQQLDAMRSWDGIPGLLANLPGVGSAFAKLINWLVLRQKKLFAWPNIWAKEEIVPELVGKLEARDVGERVIDYLTHPEKLEEMRSRLRSVRGEPGAAEKLVQLVMELLPSE
ncbi:MAG: lipid-A-disaccharide synthase [Coleofasciculaceae cyanobacterium]